MSKLRMPGKMGEKKPMIPTSRLFPILLIATGTILPFEHILVRCRHSADEMRSNVVKCEIG